MRHRLSHGASASIIIIAVLFVALMATLGVVFYQNFVGKPEQTTGRNDDTKVENGTTYKTSRVASYGAIYAMDYPEDWKVTKGAVDGGTRDDVKMVLVSPDDSVEVAFTAATGQIGGSCSAEAAEKVTFYNVQEKFNATLSGEPVALVETMYDHPGGGYDYKIGLTVEGGATHAAVGNPFCAVQYTGVAATAKYDENNKIISPMLTAKISLLRLNDGEKEASAPSMQAIHDQMNADGYKAAVKILESARKE